MNWPTVVASVLSATTSVGLLHSFLFRDAKPGARPEPGLSIRPVVPHICPNLQQLLTDIRSTQQHSVDNNRRIALILSLLGDQDRRIDASDRDMAEIQTMLREWLAGQTVPPS